MRKYLLVAIALGSAVPVLGTFLSASTAEARGGCGAGSYQNSRGHCVSRPVRANRPPAGWSARCRDGTYSFSQSRRGTCSWHGGVAVWR